MNFESSGNNKKSYLCKYWFLHVALKKTTSITCKAWTTFPILFVNSLSKEQVWGVISFLSPESFPFKTNTLLNQEKVQTGLIIVSYCVSNYLLKASLKQKFLWKHCDVYSHLYKRI